MPSVINDLALWGPGSSRTASLEEARVYCRRVALGHYENFPVVSWLLPAGLHQHFYNLYAFCRWADDLGDETGDPVRSQQLLTWWDLQIDECFAGRTQHPVMVALSETIREFQIPSEPFHQLVSAFQQDQTKTRYQSFDELKDYCARSANPVGRLVLYLCRAHREPLVNWSDSICTGLQLANFWQDLRRDFEIGRIYLPQAEMAQFEVTEEHLARHESSPQLVSLLQFQVARARQFLEQGIPLVVHMPGPLQIDIDLFIQGGLRILKKIEAARYRVLESRPVVSKWDFGQLMVGAAFRRFIGGYSGTAENELGLTNSPAAGRESTP